MEAVLRPITEVAEDLGVSRDTMDRLVARGRLAKYRKAGDRRVFVDDEEARAAVGYRKVEPPTRPD